MLSNSWVSCDWEDITQPDANGWRRVRCKRCNKEGSSPYPHDQIHGACGNPRGGPMVGSELHELLALAGATPTSSCQCAARIATMNSRGVEGCKATRDELIGWVMEGYQSLDWEKTLYAGRKLLGESWFRIADPFGSIVDEAISRAETQ